MKQTLLRYLTPDQFNTIDCVRLRTDESDIVDQNGRRKQPGLSQVARALKKAPRLTRLILEWTGNPGAFERDEWLPWAKLVLKRYLWYLTKSGLKIELVIDV